MISMSEARLADMLSRYFPAPDDVGPYNPRAALEAPALLARHRAGPDPSPWRQFVAVVEIVRVAALLEASSAGAGSAMLKAVMRDPEDWCGTGKPHGPIPPRPHLDGIDLITIGASFVTLAEGVTNAAVAAAAREGGAALMSRGAAAEG